jgi:hypothetical protein
VRDLLTESFFLNLSVDFSVFDVLIIMHQYNLNSNFSHDMLGSSTLTMDKKPMKTGLDRFFWFAENESVGIKILIFVKF